MIAASRWKSMVELSRYQLSSGGVRERFQQAAFKRHVLEA